MIKKICIFALLPSIVCAAEGSGYQQYSKGVELAAQGKCKDAMEYFQKAVKLTPAFASSYIDLARCQTLVGQRGAGLEALLKGLEKVKRNDDRQRIRKELTLLTEVFYTNDTFQRYQNGMNYLRLSRYGSAVEELTAANEKEPENVLVLLALAKATELDGNQERAQEILDKAVHWNPSKIEALEAFAAATWFAKPERIVTLLEPYKNRESPSEGIVTYYSLALTKTKRSREGLEFLRRAVEEHNDWVLGAYWLGKAFSEESNGGWQARKYLMTFLRRVDGVFQNPKDRPHYELEEFKTLKKQADALLVRVNQALQ